MMKCIHAARGCNSPEAECSGACMAGAGPLTPPEAAKPEKHCMNCVAFGGCHPSNDAGRCGYEPEQQAQAGEPEVVAYRTRLHRMSGAEYMGYNDCNPFPGLPNSGEPLITLQSHREAMAATITRMHEHLSQVRAVYKEDIAKKDAALKACVEAMKSSNYRMGEYGYQAMEKTITANDAAITQAQEALK